MNINFKTIRISSQDLSPVLPFTNSYATSHCVVWLSYYPGKALVRRNGQITSGNTLDQRFQGMDQDDD